MLPQNELDALFNKPEKISSVLYEERSEDVLDLDKAWHAIHFMLTGEVYEGEPPLSHAIFGIDPIGDEDVGYGPARGTSLEMVKEINAALLEISEKEFCSKFDADALLKADIYPQIWIEEAVLEDYLLPNFSELKKFYSDAAESNCAVITFIN